MLTTWEEALKKTPPYPSYKLKRAKGGEKNYRLLQREGHPNKVERYESLPGELLRTPNLKFIADWKDNLAWRMQIMNSCVGNPDQQELQKLICKSNILYWINTFCWTYDPRLKNPHIPFVTYEFQDELIEWSLEMMDLELVMLIEKSRDMGATWVMVAVAVWYSIFFDGYFEYMLSMTENEVDNRGVDSLLGKVRYLLTNMPDWMSQGFVEKVNGIDNKMHITVPGTNSTIRGQLTGGRAGRSGRARRALYDEFAFVDESANVRKAAASLASCQVYLSTANGMGNEFFRMADDPNINKITLHWTRHPLKNKEWEAITRPQMSPEDWAQEHDISYATSTKGRVYDDFVSFSSSEYNWAHCQSDDYFDYDPNYDVYVGIDFGMRDPTSVVFAQIRPAPRHFTQWGKECLIIFDEIEKTDWIVDRWAEYLKGLPYRYREIVGDYRSGNQRDATGQTWIKYLAAHGLQVQGKYNTEQAPIVEVKRRLAIPGAFAINHRKCPHTVKAFQNWSYKIDKDTGLVMHGAKPNHDQWSHNQKAVCYLIDYIYGKKKSRKREVSSWDFNVYSEVML